jgi:hypothetical protein
MPKEEASMTYAIVIESAGGTIEVFHQVAALLPEQEPDGLLARVAGQSERGVAVISVWRSKKDADRFFAEHHLPALTKVLGGPPPPPTAMIEFEATDVLMTASAPSA